MATRAMRALLGIAVLLLGLSRAAAGQVAVIVHPTVAADTLDQATLLDIYSGELGTWPNKQAVQVFDLKGRTVVKEAFYRFLGRTTSQMKSVWMKKLLLGESQPPTSVFDDAEMMARVAATPGAIGYVPAGSAVNTVKILLLIPEDASSQSLSPPRGVRYAAPRQALGVSRPGDPGVDRALEPGVPSGP